MRRILLAAGLSAALAGLALADVPLSPMAEGGDPRAQYSPAVMREHGLPKDAAAGPAQAARQGYVPASAAPGAKGKPTAVSRAKPLRDVDRVAEAMSGFLAQTIGPMKAAAPRVRRAGPDVFDVTFEGAELVDGSERYGRLGPFRAQARRAGDDAWRIELAAPPEIEGIGVHGPFRISAQGRTAFVWDEQLAYARSIDFDWRDVVVSGDGPPIRTARVLFAGEMVQFPDDRWRTPTDLRIEGVEVTEGEKRIRIEQITMRADMAGNDLARLLQLIQRNPPDSLPDLSDLFSEASIEVGLKDMRLEDPKLPFALDEVSFSLGLANLDKPAFDLRIGYGHAGFAGRADQPADALTPRDARLKLTLAKLPMEALWGAALEYMLTGELNSHDMLRDMLAEAGTRLNLDESLFQTAKTRVTADGSLAADRAAVLGVVGALGLTVAGMEELVSASARAEGDGAATSKMLAALARIGRRGPNGKTLTYRIELGADGLASVNGEPLGRFLAAGSAQ